MGTVLLKNMIFDSPGDIALRRFRHSRANLVIFFFFGYNVNLVKTHQNRKEIGGIQAGLAHRGPRKMAFFKGKHLFSR